MVDRNPHLLVRDIERIVDTVFNEIAAALIREDRVELRGFGAFWIKRREARIGRNPRTGVSVSVSEKLMPCFRVGKRLRERLNSEL